MLRYKNKASENRKIKISYKISDHVPAFSWGYNANARHAPMYDLRLRMEVSEIGYMIIFRIQHYKCKRKDGIPKKRQNQMRNRK